ncbi:MAG: response regulator, partial [Lachnospiraceae bacterium]|nr:response regulator [Lachnospiraceae bacterium]
IGKKAADIGRKDYALTKIEDSSQHLLGVINDILDISKIEANKLELFMAEFELAKTLQRVFDIIKFRSDEKKQEFVMEIDEAIPRTLIGDAQRLAQIITNLLGNAVKFTPEAGTVKLAARLLGADENGVCTVQITVTDTGIGISPEQKARLFQSYQQADATTYSKFGGTGLGLAISKSIVELMGGEIWVESEMDKGSSFIFTFKAERGAGEAYHLILMDVQMPEMDGHVATRRIRSLDVPGAATIPIIAMTANVFREDIEECLASGMNGHLGKPLDFNKLMEVLRRYLSGISEKQQTS